MPEMPPLWSFGYKQSHRTLAGPDEIMWVAKTFREKKLPCDALIYLGTDFTPSGWNTHNGEFTWKPENFPEPKKAIDELHALHYKVVLHIVIEGRRMSGTVDGPCTPDKAVPSGRTADDRWPDDRAVGCYWPHHKALIDLGIDGWWPDQGDGLDAPSRLARIRMYWEGSQQWRPNERPFALHRNGYAGMQRYGAFLWSGDVYSTWETLKTHVPVAVNTGSDRHSVLGHRHRRLRADDGVHRRAVRPLVPVRRVLPVVPLARPDLASAPAVGLEHRRARTARRSRPTPAAPAIPTRASCSNAQVEPICRKYLELRYRLMPYTYTVARECCDTGLPIMRALWLHYPDDPVAVARGDQYLWGRDILVAPVVEKGATSAAASICRRGTWYDFWTEETRRRRPRDRSRRSIWRRCRSTSAPARSFHTVPRASTSISRRPIR